MLRDVIHLFFPELCVACGAAVPPPDSPLCIKCEMELPRALVPRGPQFVERVFWGRLPVNGAYAWLRFRKDNRARDLLHTLKYGGNPSLVREMGRRFARDLQRVEMPALPSALVPVPLHPRKLRLRGYNQAEMIALGMSDVLEIPVESGLLQRVQHRASLTKLGRVDRYAQIKSGYACRRKINDDAQHLCLVDDVITTGATLEVCGSLLLEGGARYLSMASLAYAEQMF